MTPALAAYTSRGTLKHGGGYMDNLQSGKFVQVSGLKTKPRAGSNVEFDNQQNVFYKLVAVKNLLGGDVIHSTVTGILFSCCWCTHTTQESAEVRLRYPKYVLTGHDLEIGTGNFTQTNYPNHRYKIRSCKMKPEKVVVVECSRPNRSKMVTLELADCLTLNSQLVLLHLMLMHLTFADYKNFAG